MKKRARYLSIVAGALMLLAFMASTIDGQTHQRSLFFAFERIALIPLAFTAITSFGVAFYSKEERAQHGVLFFVSLPAVVTAAAILSYAGYALYRLLL